MAKTVRDDLAEVIAVGVNKLFKTTDGAYGKVAFVGDTDETPTDLSDFLSTGCAPLDLAISNRPHGGIPFGRITELTGLEGSGKSLVSAHMMANVQKMGGVAVLIDTETAVNWEFFKAVGVDTKSLVYANLDTVEEIFSTIENIIETVRATAKNKDKPVIIVVDSIAAASTKAEMEADYDKDGWATGKSIIISKALRKITSTIGKQKIALIITNQLRQRLGAMPFSDPYTTSGGMALRFHSSVRIRFSLTGKITKKSGDSKEVVGVTVKAQVIKNRVGPPHRSATFSIYFDRGIDDYGSWLEFLRERKLIDGKSNALKYTSALSGVEYSFTEAEWPALLNNNAELKEELYQALCDTYIMMYKTEGIGASDFSSEPSTDE